MKKRLFISHASEDKDGFVRPLAEALRADFDVWYDEYSLVMGCSLLEEISNGLGKCDFGVVVLSNHFFAKNWPQQELNGLFALEEKDKKVILPVWKDVSKEDVMRYSPILADRLAAKAEDGVDKVVNEIKRAVAFFERGKSVERPTPGYDKLRTSLEKKAEKERSQRIVGSGDGVSIALDTAKETIDILARQLRSLLEQGSIKGIRIEGPTGDGIDYRVGVWIGKISLHACYVNNVINSAADARMDVGIFQLVAGRNGMLSERRPRELQKERYSLYIDMSDGRFWKSKSGELLSPEELVDKWLGKLSARIESK